MEKNTLLDFLTQRASEQTTADFRRVLSKEDPKELSKIFKLLFKSDNPEWFYQFDDSTELKDIVPDNEESTLRKKMTDALKAMGKGIWEYYRGKDPLDMTAKDIENLFEVYKDPNTRDMEIDVLLNPQDLRVSTKTKEQIEADIGRFYKEYEHFFDSAKSINYDTQKSLLSFKGSEYVLRKLLDYLDVKDETKEFILKKSAELKGTWYIPFQPPKETPEGEDAKNVPLWIEFGALFQTYEEFKLKFQESYEKLALKDHVLEKNQVDWVEYGDREYLVFNGTLKQLRLILQDMFGAPTDPNAIIKQIDDHRQEIFNKRPD